MNQNQTGSHGEDQALPRRHPWASFATHGMPPEPTDPRAEVPPGRPPWAGHAGRHRYRRQGLNWRGVLAVFGTTVLALGSCTTPAPAAAKVAPPPAVIDWPALPTPTVTPAAQRRIEIVDQIIPATWKVGAAAEWLDRYTASDMVVVARCSGTAWKCVTVKGGKLPGSALAMAGVGGDWITVDTAKVDRRGYRSDSARKRILAHELAHTFGVGHSSGRNLMATTLGRVSLKLTAGQRAYLRAR